MGWMNCTNCGYPMHTSKLPINVCNACEVNGFVEPQNQSNFKEDTIEHPKHYNFANIQPIDVIEDWKLDFRLANAVKYIARAGKKDPMKTKEDLEKALWYIRRFIEKEC